MRFADRLNLDHNIVPSVRGHNRPPPRASSLRACAWRALVWL
jgi:hypothetical protein